MSVVVAAVVVVVCVVKLIVELSLSTCETICFFAMTERAGFFYKKDTFFLL